MNILFVCTGNTCRSPMAEGYLKSKNIEGVCVLSRGLYADGSPVSEKSLLAMKEQGIDISSHISSQISLEDIKWADKIICLSNSHLSALLGAGVEESKLSVLGNGICDPFGGDLEVYKACLDEIMKEIDMLFGEISVCLANEVDIEAIASLEAECFSEPWSQKTLCEFLNSGNILLVAKKNSSIIGYLGASVILDEGYITNIAVTKPERKKGAATALLNKLFETAKEKKLSFVSLEVRVSNDSAISLYEKFGFKTEGKRKNFYQNPTEDALIMTKRFNF